VASAEEDEADDTNAAIDRDLRRLLQHFGVDRVATNSVLEPTRLRGHARRGWRTALDRALRPGPHTIPDATSQWLRCALRRVADSECGDPMRAQAAEIEAALRLSWIGPVERVPEGKQSTCDFRMGNLNVEVYCPQEHVQERRVVQAVLDQHSSRAVGPVRVALALSHPTTGSGHSVDGTATWFATRGASRGRFLPTR
jgi:hypothetical protein